MSKVYDGLRGDAFVKAQEVGLDRLWQSGDEDNGIPAGVDLPVKAMKTSVFPLTTREAKERVRQ